MPKSSILLAGTGVWKISSVAFEFSPSKTHLPDYPKVKSVEKMKFVFFTKISL